jgi:hypothetical protein
VPAQPVDRLLHQQRPLLQRDLVKRAEVCTQHVIQVAEHVMTIRPTYDRKRWQARDVDSLSGSYG